MRTRLFLAVVLSAVATVSAPLVSWAAADGASPAINQSYQNPDFQEWQARFERSGREVFDRRLDIARESGIRPGMDVADVGAGTGLFTLLFASLVGPDGTVYAVDISRPFIDNVLRRAAEAKLDNVRGIVNSQTGTQLPPASVDLVFISDAYHHFEQPRSMLQSVRDALRPGGRLVIIDFRRIPGKSSGWLMEHVRAGRETVIQEVEAAGFRLRADKDLLRENFFLIFDKST